MASSNVEFYQKMIELQNESRKKEEERLKLENEMSTRFQSDHRMAKLRAVKLNSYWKHLCENEKRSKERNQQILREFERMDTHISSTTAQLEKLKFAKKQFEEAIERKYPKWREMVHVPPFPSDDILNGKVPESAQPSKAGPSHSLPEHQKGTADQGISDLINQSQRQPDSLPSRPTDIIESPKQSRQPDSLPSRPKDIIESPKQSHPQPNSLPSRPKDIIESPAYKQNASPIRMPPVDHMIDKNTNQQSAEEHITLDEADNLHFPPLQKQSSTTSQKSGLMQPENDSDFASDIDLPLSDGPAKSPEKKSPEKAGDDNPGLQGTGEAIASIDTEVVSPLNRSASKPLRTDMTLTGILYLLKYVQDHFRDAFVVDGYYRTTQPDSSLKSDIIQKANNAKNLSPIDGNIVSMVILEQLTLVVRDLVESGLLTDAMLMSDITQLTAESIGSSLPTDACELWDGLFDHFKKLVEFKVMDPKGVAAIFVPCLVADGSKYQQTAFNLLVRLLEECSKDLGVIESDESSAMSPVRKIPSPAKDTPRSQQSTTEHGGVPPLKFGSLVDRPFSDDESTSIFNSTSRSQPAVPLNETDAYKNMLSGTRSMNRNPTVVDDEDEDTDNDVEKQFASALSPRTPKSTAAPSQKPGIAGVLSPRSQAGSIPSARSSKGSTMQSTGSYPLPPKRTGIKIGSDLDTDTEVDYLAQSKNKTKVEDDSDFDFYN